ncbi:hypothetical protein [Kingella oralis]|uniref:Uncharacterized protein n=1 Tax=Kingella oralis ATCC 51147 TaxID=629741 RepID=C4GL69_9NEIS|nr:hypothetical protein [Kingella oralis]EEP67478.1 hypothetical protein GCWU000324_01726 [Kingella oralis ATCC 51147]QMT43606.1 hypothetical protein H3L93_04550 [Kingella oralis]
MFHFAVSGCLWDWANVSNRVRSQAAHSTRIFQAASVYPQRQPETRLVLCGWLLV